MIGYGACIELHEAYVRIHTYAVEHGHQESLLVSAESRFHHSLGPKREETPSCSGESGATFAWFFLVRMPFLHMISVMSAVPDV